MVPVTVSGLGPYVPDPPTTLLLDLSLVEEAIQTTDEARGILEDARVQAQQILDTARGEADSMLANAKTEAEDITTAASDEARRIRSEVTGEAEAMRAEYADEADRLRAETEQSLEDIREAAHEDRARAVAELEAARSEVDVIIREAKAAAAALVEEAQESANRTYHAAQEDAIAEAARILESARLDAERIVSDSGERITDLQALHEIELATLAEREAQLAARIVELESAIGAEPTPLQGRHAAEARSPGQEDREEPLPELPKRKAQPVDETPSPWMVPETSASAEEGQAVAPPEEEPLDDGEDREPEDVPERTRPEVGSSPRPAQTLIEPLRPAVFRATATEPGRKKRRRK